MAAEVRSRAVLADSMRTSASVAPDGPAMLANQALPANAAYTCHQQLWCSLTGTDIRRRMCTD